MRVLICPDKFKGSLDAPSAARAIQTGWARVWPRCEFRHLPLADGGEGFLDAMLRGAQGQRVTVRCPNAAGQPIRAAYGWIPDQQAAIIEMAQAAGLAQLPEPLRDPRSTSTDGVGHLIAAAAARGAATLYIGLGGSATNDGGSGLARALGWRFLDARGRPLRPGGLALNQLDRIEPPAEPWFAPARRPPRLIVACDVTNPLLGPRGATAIFAPQKGAQLSHLPPLERGLARLAELTDPDLASKPGAGAAGGTAFGLMTFLGARLKPGFDLVADAMRLSEAIDWADLVITGEGSLDDQSLRGKVIGRLAALCRRRNRPLLALAGSVPPRVSRASVPSLSLAPGPIALPDAVAQAAPLLASAASRAARLLQLGQSLQASR